MGWELIFTDSSWYYVGSFNNSIIGNVITDNPIGVGFWFASNNLVCDNVVANNSYGFKFLYNQYQITGSSIDNRIFQNNIANAIQVEYEQEYANNWDNGIEGNNWSDYNGTDSDHDGIGDTAHIIDANNTDNYPLMGMFSDFNATSELHVQTVCNSRICDFQFNGTAIMFNVTGVGGTTGFCRICIPTALMNDTFMVFVNGTEILPSPEPLPCSNSTHIYLYFAYSHSTQEVIIIPEFPSLIILPLFMIATLLAVIFHRRKDHILSSMMEKKGFCGRYFHSMWVQFPSQTFQDVSKREHI